MSLVLRKKLGEAGRRHVIHRLVLCFFPHLCFVGATGLNHRRPHKPRLIEDATSYWKRVKLLTLKIEIESFWENLCLASDKVYYLCADFGKGLAAIVENRIGKLDKLAPYVYTLPACVEVSGDDPIT